MEGDSYSIQEFCARHGISRSAFYKAIDIGQAPKLMRVGSRVTRSGAAKVSMKLWPRPIMALPMIEPRSAITTRAKLRT